MPLTHSDYSLSQLDVLEAESIHVIREVAAEFERPVLLFSGGKDSIVMLALAERAFWPAKVPFPVMHVDTGHNFPEVIEFRDRRVADTGVRLVVASVQESIDAGRVAEDIGAALVPLGSAGAKAAAVILGEADAYLHGGGQYEWDSAAPVAVARAAGLHTSRLDGSRLEYNQGSPWQPDILICPGKIADRLLSAIGTARRTGTE